MKFFNISRRFGLGAKFMLVTVLLAIVPLLLIWFQVSRQIQSLQISAVNDAKRFALKSGNAQNIDESKELAGKYADKTEKRFSKLVSRIFIANSVFVLMAAVILLIAVNFFARRFFGPLKLLDEGMSDWDGASTFDVVVEGDDEIARLSRQFSLMSEKIVRLSLESNKQKSDLESAQSELKTQSSTLEEQIQKRTSSLRTALEKLRSVDKAKDEFITLITHELKTPLTSISACAEALSGHVSLPEQTKKQFVNIILDETERLTRLINEVLDYSRISAGLLPIMFRRTNLVRLLERAVLMHRASAEKAEIKLRFLVDDPVDERLKGVPMDSDRIQQVMANMLSNALKFTPNGGNVSVHASIITKKIMGKNTNLARVVVSDSGIGIDREDRAKVFDRFVQTEKMDHHSEGSGLGIPIAKGIIKGHGGKIWFVSTPGSGTDFYFTLPLEQNLKKYPGSDENGREDLSNEE